MVTIFIGCTSLSSQTRLADGFGSKSNPTPKSAIHPKKWFPRFRYNGIMRLACNLQLLYNLSKNSQSFGGRELEVKLLFRVSFYASGHGGKLGSVKELNGGDLSLALSDTERYRV